MAAEDETPMSGVPMGYLVLGLMGLGGVGEVLCALQGSEALLTDSMTPMLLLLLSLSFLATAALAVLRRRDRVCGMPALPPGEQQVTMHELGWDSCPAGSGVPPVHAWSEIYGQRVGRRVLTLLTHDGQTVGVPLRALREDDGGWVERLLMRKVVRGL